MKNEKSKEEKAAIESKLTKEIEAQEEEKQKQLEKEIRAIREANERFSRVKVLKDKRGRELIIRPHKFPRNLPWQFIIMSVFMLPFFLFFSMLVPGEGTLPGYVMWIIRSAIVAVVWSILIWFIGREGMQTWRIRITKDGNYFVYGRNPDKPKWFGKRKDFFGEAVRAVHKLMSSKVRMKGYDPTFHIELLEFTPKDIEMIQSFFDRV